MKADEEDLDLEARQLLQRGYGDLVPSAAKKEFILGALSVRLPGALGPAVPTATMVGTSAAEGVLRAKWVLGALVVGALGFGLGVIVSRPSMHAQSELTESPSTRSADRGSGRGEGVPTGLELSQLEVEVGVPERSVAFEEKVVGAGRVRQAGGNADKGPSKEAAPVTFYEELSYIRRAQTALAAGNPALALGLMQSLKDLHADGALLAERGMTEVLALCALGREDEARDLGMRVRSRGDGSMYAARLERTCARSRGPDDSSEDSLEVPTSTEQSSRRP